MHLLTVFLVASLLAVWSPGPSFSQTLAFPTAEGYGRFAEGGRGGKAYLINNLSAGDGDGGSCNAGGCSGGTITFRDCVLDRFGVGKRTCIFRTGGLIDFSVGDTTSCVECLAPIPPYLTIAGQTAPGGGIMLKGIALSMRSTHNVIIRHLRSRPGADSTAGEHSSLKAFAVAAYNAPTHDIIFDHCSAGWNHDDATATAGVGDNVTNVTWQWMLLSEGLENPNFGWYGKAGILDGWVGNVSYLHNLLANFVDRLPYVEVGIVQYVNNIIYNAPGALNVLPWYGDIQLAVVNNYWKQGSASADQFGRPEAPYIRELCTATDDCQQPGQLQNCAGGAAAYQGRCACTGSGFVEGHCTTQIYVQDNYHSAQRPTGSEPQDAIIRWAGDNSGNDVPSYTTLPPGFPVMPTIRDQTSATQAYTDVLAKAGAYRVHGTYGGPGGIYATDRSDTPDSRARTDTINGTGLWRMDHQSEVGGYDTYAAGTPYADTDGDGMADDWEDGHGLDKTSAADGPLIAGNGYSNLENFLNELAGDVAAEPSITTDLVAHYPFNDSAATATDATGHGHTGTLLGAPSYGTGAPGLGGGLVLNGTSQGVTIPDAPDLDLTTAYTLSAWVRPTTSPTTWAAIAVKNYVYYLYAGSVTGLVCGGGGPLGGHASQNGCDATPLAAGTWTHVAVTFDGGTVRLYRNGAAVGTTTATTTPASVSTGTLQLGTDQYDEWFGGSIDEVRLYSRPLTPAEITLLRDYQDTSTTPPTLTLSTVSGSSTTVPVTVLGTATDDLGVVSLTVSCVPSCGTPVVTCTPACGAAAASVSWSANVPLVLGDNVVTVTATDSLAQVDTETLTLTLLPAMLINQSVPLGHRQ